MSVNLSQAKVDEKKPSLLKNIGAAAAGSVTGTAVTAGGLLVTTPLLQRMMKKVAHSINADEVNILNKAGQQVFQETGLVDKGVKMLKNFTLEERIAVRNLFKMVPQCIRKMLKKAHPLYATNLGINAFFDTIGNRVICPNKMALSQFHELGHAMNKNGILGKQGFFGKLFQDIRLDMTKQANIAKMLGQKIPTPIKARLLAFTAAAIPFIALFKNKKAEGEQPKGFWDKTTTFIKNNAGKLTFATTLPMIFEEAIASFKGESFAKKLLSPELFKKVKLQNRTGLLSYIALGIFSGISAMLAVKVRDRIAQPDVK